MSVSNAGLSATYAYGGSEMNGGGVGQILNQIKKTANKIGNSRVLSKGLKVAGGLTSIFSEDVGKQLSEAADKAKQAGAGKKHKKSDKK